LKFISLKWKISGILIFSNLVIGILLIIIVDNVVSSGLQKELIQIGKTIAVNLAQYSAEGLLEEDKVALKEMATGAKSFESVEYILILNSEGAILADTYNGSVPAELTAVEKSEAEAVNLVEIKKGDVAVYDISYPVEDGELGAIRVGMKKSYIDETVFQTIVTLLLTIVGVTVAGILLVLLLATKIIRPILYLTERADKISQGELEEKVKVDTNDEIAQLGDALERLRESVKLALDRLKKHQTLRI
jgi:methyl-accepting chemotaxis protein